MKSFIVRGFLGTILVWSLVSSQGLRAAPPVRHDAPRPTIRYHILHTEKWFRRHRAHVILSYPVVTGMQNQHVEQEINQHLRGAYPAGGLASYLRPEAADLARGEGLHLDGSSSVKLLRGHLMSVYYEGMEYLTRHGKFIGAYPNNLYSSVTVDLRSGRVVHLRDLFHTPGWRKKLDNLITRAVRRTTPELDAPSIREGVIAHRYDFYLTPDHIEVFNIFDIHALSGIQVALPRQAVQGL